MINNAPKWKTNHSSVSYFNYHLDVWKIPYESYLPKENKTILILYIYVCVSVTNKLNTDRSVYQHQKEAKIGQGKNCPRRVTMFFTIHTRTMRLINNKGTPLQIQIQAFRRDFSFIQIVFKSRRIFIIVNY